MKLSESVMKNISVLPTFIIEKYKIECISTIEGLVIKEDGKDNLENVLPYEYAYVLANKGLEILKTVTLNDIDMLCIDASDDFKNYYYRLELSGKHIALKYFEYVETSKKWIEELYVSIENDERKIPERFLAGIITVIKDS